MVPFFRLTLTLLLTVLNFFVILLPFFAVMAPVFYFRHDTLKEAALFFAVVTVVIMSVYLFLDLLFGFSIRQYRKDTVKVRKDDELYKPFAEAKKSFGVRGVRLFTLPSEEVTAYAVSIFFRKYIVISTPLLDMLRFRYGGTEEYSLAVKGIISHEMSHLANGDSVSAQLINSNVHALSVINSILAWGYNTAAGAVGVVPVLGPVVRFLAWLVHFVVSFVLNSVMKVLIYPLHKMMMRAMDRAAEYRCDRDAAELTGVGIYKALCIMPSGGGDSVFSTHPPLDKRLKKLENFRVPVTNPAIVIPKRFNVEKLAVNLYMVLFIALCLLAVYAYTKGYRI